MSTDDLVGLDVVLSLLLFGLEVCLEHHNLLCAFLAFSFEDGEVVGTYLLKIFLKCLFGECELLFIGVVGVFNGLFCGSHLGSFVTHLSMPVDPLNDFWV